MSRAIFRRIHLPDWCGLLILAGGLAATYAPPTRASVRVALMNLICEDNSYRDTLAAENFTVMLQAQVSSMETFEWVERSELSRVEQEFKLAHLGLIDRFEALRNGRWLKADWAVLGRISTNAANCRTVSLEVVDLDHAETLARSTVDITGAGVPLRVKADDVAHVAQSLRVLLKQAEFVHTNKQGRLTVGLLFLTGSPKGPDHGRFINAFVNAVSTNQPTVHLIQFQHAGEAMDEAGLVLSGLGQTDHNAWEKVADVYVWGSYNVKPQKTFNWETRQWDDEQNVTVSLNVWNGRFEPRTIALSFTNPPNLEGVAISTARALAPWFQRAPKNLTEEGSRRQISQSLVDHTVKQAATFPNDLLTSPEGRQRWMDLVQLLETACFFDPSNQEARELWLRVRWGKMPMATSPNRFFFARRRSEAWRKYVDEFGFSSKCPRPVNAWWDLDSVSSEFVLSAWQVYEMFNFSQYDLARWGVPYDTGGPELQGWRRQFGEEFCLRLEIAPDDPKVLGRVRELFYGLLAMNGNEFVISDARRRQALIDKLWPHVLEAQRARPAEFDEAYLRPLRLHFEQIGQRGTEQVWLGQLAEITRSANEKERAKPIQLPRASSLDSENQPPNPRR